jgi:hypothetical protein
MKQAILITAYKNLDHLAEIVDYFPKDCFDFYIHYDKKSKIDKDDLRVLDVKFLSRKYKVNWGGRNHLKSILLLAKKALQNKDIAFFHLISGQDFPVKEPSYFTTNIDLTKNYMEFFPMPAKCWPYGGMDRVELFNFYDLFDARKNMGVIMRIRKFQKDFRIKRPISKKLPTLYGGSTWWSLTRDALQYVIDYTDTHGALIRRLKYSFCSEEIYFQTVLMNSRFAENTVNDNLRYIDWDSGRGGYPAVIDISDYISIKASNKLFARKFESSGSDALKQLLIKDNKP